MYGWWKSSRRFAIVQPPWTPLNAPTITLPAGRNRNRKTYAKNGTVTIHARLRRLRPDLAAGRSASRATSTAMVYAPTFDGHCDAMSAFAAVCCPDEANFTFA